MNRRSVKVKISSEVLRKLRENSGYTIQEVAKKLGTSELKIEDIEKGKDTLTLTQIKKLAEIYKCPLAAFFSDTISVLPSLTDFRINRNKRLTPDVYFAKRRAYYLLKELEQITTRESLIPQFPSHIEPEELADKFRIKIQMKIIKNKKPREILKFYKREIENKMFIPVIEYPLKADDIRAFSILSRVSIIVLNEDDEPQVKMFSLFHEIGHLLRRSSGICSIEMEPEQKEDIETFCNKFAANLLVPSEDLKGEIRRQNIVKFNIDRITELSEIYGVSKQVIMLRLLWLGYIDSKQYYKFKSIYEKPIEKKYGRRNWDEVFLNRTGEIIVKEVKQAYEKGALSFADVIEILGIKTKYVKKFLNGVL